MSAYIVFTRIKTLDQKELELYWNGIRDTMKGHPIEVLAAYGKHEMLEGSPPVEGVVIAKFPDMKSAKEWYGSEAYQNVARHRQSGAIYHGLIVEGVIASHMKNNLALVTGATSGIGYSAAKLLAQDGWGQVMVTGRSQSRVDEVVNRLKTDTGTQNITGIALDLNSFVSVKKAVAELVKRGMPIDFLVLNAGLIPRKERVVTSENIESSQAPLIGHHQLTMGLLAAGLLAPDARIVIAGSEAARGDVPLFRYTNLATFSAKEFGGDRVAAAEAILRGSSKVNYQANTAYADAKVFVAWWVAVLARKIPEKMGIYAISPGSTPDTLGLRSGSFMLRHVMVPILRLLPGMTQTPEEAAKRYLAAINFGVEDSGKFFASPPKKMTGPMEVMRQEHFHDRANQDALWRAVVNVSGVDGGGSIGKASI